MRQIATHESDQAKKSQDSADFGKKIAEKRKKRAEAYLKLQKEQQNEQKKQDKANQQIQASYEARIKELQQQLLQPVGLFGAAAQQVAFIGPFMELLGYGEQHLGRRYFVGFGEPYVPEREDKAALAALEHPTYGAERAEPFRTGERAVGHKRIICGVRQDGVRGFSWPACAVGCG